MSKVLFSQSSGYAIRALIYLARQPVGKLSGTREISSHEAIPRAFLGKVLVPLRRARLLRALKGTRGGYDLAVPPEEISLLAIVRCIDGPPLSECLLEDHECSKPRECLLHPYWSVVRDELLNYLARTTVADLARLRLSERGIDC